MHTKRRRCCSRQPSVVSEMKVISQRLILCPLRVHTSRHLYKFDFRDADGNDVDRVLTGRECAMRGEAGGRGETAFKPKSRPVQLYKKVKRRE